ncbi:hypothetical protein [Terriglobus roseus]|uniref:Outer membrane lipoprotein-sorting protein n=1 Tax=Terriglobus roseus TaxID=392734 RepID=A0A1G7IK63_9BACT|nr:hypothetical protein [Terriglobus roseus]SDF12699.1 hypothetical protein SAMN05444167_1468 [Terriglobus roseus]
MLRIVRNQYFVWLVMTSLFSSFTARAQESLSPSSISAILQQAVQFQLDDFHHRGWGLQYRIHRLDQKEDSIREVIETEDGNISRTLTFKGRPLTAEEETGELARLRALTPEDVRKRRQKSESSDKYGIELMKTLPKAMLFTPVAGQPQLPNYPRQQVVLDYAPNPQFHPGSTTQSLLMGIAGRIWIDAETHHLTRIEVRIIQNLNLMFGILARVYQGGTLSYEQKPVSLTHDAFSEIKMDVKLRELMVHVAPYQQTLTVTDVRFLPTAPSVHDAVNTLLAIPAVKP